MAKKNPAAVALGKRSVKARMEKLTAEQRTEIARKAAQARWARAKAKPAKKARKKRAAKKGA